jgi:hypothetical protein
MLTLQFIPFAEIGSLSSEEKLKRLLKVVQEDKIILLEGKLKSNEKSELIRKTMEQINEKFKGIEIEELDIEQKNNALMEKIRSMFINMLLGDRRGFTIIGPASIIKEIKKDPDKIQLLTEEVSSAAAKKKKR